jgi:hypothetical protein
MTITLPKRCPTNSGCDDGRLFVGTLPKRAPTLRCFNGVICGCGKSGVLNDGFDATRNNSFMGHKFVPVPEFI